MIYTLDANIFLRDLTPRDPDHAVCHAVLEQIRRDGHRLVVPQLLVVEVAGVLSREVRDPMRGRMAILALQTLPTITFVDMSSSFTHHAAEIAADCAIRGADAVYVAVAQQYQAMLVTFDREVRERAARIVHTCTPYELVVQWGLPPTV